jgi:peptidyl-prolyl cis-trans isomerase C
MKLSFTAFFFASAVCLLAQAPAPIPEATATVSLGPAVSPDKVVITVGDATLTAGQFEQLVEMLPEQNRSAARGPGKKQFAEQIVRVLALAQEGKRRKLDETRAYQTQSHFQAENLLAGKAVADLAKVDDAELRKYYDAHKADFEQVRARHILIRAKGSPVPAEAGKKELTDEEALAKAQELRKKIMGGADFAKVASEESDDNSKTSGGDLNFFKRGQLVPPFEQAAFALKIGDVSEPVKTPFGYHLIKVEDKREEPFEDAKAEIERRLGSDRSKTVVEDLVKKAAVTLDPEFFGPPAGAPAAPQPK